MNQSTNSTNRPGRTLISGLLAYVLLTSQLAPMALAFNGSPVRDAPAKAAKVIRRHSKVVTSDDRDDRFAPVPVPLSVSPAILAPSITATKLDTYPSAPGDALPGEIITYSITITNSGPDPATNVTLSDTVDPNTTIVGTPKSTPIGFDDAFSVIGNVRIQVPDGASDLLANDLDPDTDTNAGLTITTLAGDNSAPFAGTSASGGQVTAVTGDGSFQYNPAPGFTGTDTFTYVVTDSDGGTSNATVTLTVSGLIWFVQDGAAAGGDGRFTNPFNCFVGTNCFDDTTLDDPGDNIFLYSGNYIGGQTLLNNQRLIGQGATDTLANIGGVTVPTFSDPLPSTGGASPIITTAIAATNGVSLGQGNLLRGFTVGNTTGAKISGTGFGTLTVGNNSSPDVILNGAGRALNLTTGTFAATSGFTSVATTSSSTQGISLAGVAGTVSFGSTTVSGATSQGILVGTTTADINFGNTSVSGGTIGISLQNNSAGTRTFGTLSISNNSGVGFLHAAGGGNVNVTGATSIPAAAQTAPVGTGIDIQSLAVGTTVTFAATTVNKGNAGTGVNLGAAATPNAGNVTFNSLAITTANGSGLIGTGNTGQINVNAGSISSTNGPGINITKAAAPATPISLNFSTVSSTNSATTGINLGRVSGNLTIATSTVTNPTGIGIQVANTSAGGTMNFGNTNVSSSAGTGVSFTTNAGGVTFADLDISPDSGQRALQSTSSTGTITSTSGDVAATSNVTFQITGLNAANPTPLAMVLNNLDSTNSSSIGVDLNFVSGNLTVNDATLATNISNPTGIGIQVRNTAAGGTMNFGNTNVSSSGGTGVSLSTNGGGVAFADLDISPDSGQRALQSTNSTGTITSTSGDVAATSNVTFQVNGVSAASRTPLAMVLNNLDSTNSVGIGVDLNFVSGNLTVNDATLATNISNPTGIGIRVQNTAAGGTMNFGNTNVSSSGGTGVSFTTNAGGVTFGDLDISPDSGQRALQSTSSTGTITSTSGDVTATSNITLQITGLNAANRTPLAIVLNNLDSTNSTGIGVDLNFVSGNLTVNDATLATNISNPTGIGIQVQNTAAGGTMNFGNTNVSSSGGTGVFLNANGGGVTFADLDISPDAAQRPFLATNNTGVITSTSGTITAQTGAIAVGITNAAGTVPLNMQLTSVSATSAANGIVLTNTSSSGSPGGFIVNGDGTDTTVGGNATGGTIANATGANNATAGNGVFLSNANGVTLRRMTINGTNQNHGIRGIGSSNVVLEFLTVAGSNGTSAAIDEGSVNFDNLLISAAITGCVISGGIDDNLNIVNTSGTLNRLTITDTTFDLNNSVSGATSIFIQAQNAGTTLNFTLQSSTIKGARTDWINATSSSSSTMNAIIGGATPALGNTFTNLAPDNNPGALAGGNRVLLSSVGTLTFDINNNTLKGSRGEAIRVQTMAAGALTGTGDGRVRNNTIGIQATANSGSSANSGIHLFGDGGSDMTAAVTNNQVFQYNSHGILFTFGNEVNDGSVFNATVTGNTVNTPGNLLSGFNGINLNNGTVAATDNFTTCIDIGGTGLENNIVGSGSGAVSPNNQQFQLQQRQSTTVNLPGYGGANNNNAAVVAYIQGRNIVTAGNGAASNSVPTGGGYVNTAGQCTQPSAPETLVADVTKPGDAPGETGSPAATVQEVAAPSSTDSITARPFISSAQGAQGTTEAPATTEVPATAEAKPDTQTTVANRAPVQPVANNQPPQTAPPKLPDNPSATPPVIGPGGSSLTWNVGTLPAGRSVTITFSVQVESPYSGPPQVSNQGLVSFGGGGGPVLTDDPSVGGASDPTVTPVAPTPEVSIRDARVAEPTSGTTSMLFTVALSAPASQLATIDYSTANGTAVEPGDYVAVTTGSTTFQVGEQIKVIPITVNSDADATEVDEDFTVTISANPTIANVVDATATGTITIDNPAGTILISEMRTSGPTGAGDDFVEIYNNTDTPHTVPAGGYGLFKMGADCNALPVLIGTIPAATVIPQRGHYVFVGSTYSLTSYAGADATLTTDIESDFNVGLFTTVDPLQVSTANRLDAVGFGVNTGEVCSLLLEGTTLQPAQGSISEHSFVREFTLVNNDVPTPTDGNDNAVDFTLVSTTPGTPVGQTAAPRLGAPGPENLAGPNLKKFSLVGAERIDPMVSHSTPPNRFRDTTPDPPNNSTLGTIAIRRSFTNNTGGDITRLRFRLYDITTFPSPVGTADLRARTSSNVVVTITGGGMVTALATTLETPPAQPISGGLNSSLSAGTVTLGTPLANGGTIHLNFLFGVQQSGSFRVFVIVEALP